MNQDGMPTGDLVVTGVRCTVVGATAATNWVFVEVLCGTDSVGTGEATLSGHEDDVLRYVDSVASLLIGNSPDDPQVLRALDGWPRPDLVASAAVSGVVQAVEDLCAQLAGHSLAGLATGTVRATVPLYATVNRLLLEDRSPAAFAEAAAMAAALGFHGVKCAPFDGVRPETALRSEGRALVAMGLARLRAVARELDGRLPLMVDCHGRFDAASAPRVLPALAEAAPAWVESIVADTDQRGWDAVAGFEIVLAAGETLTRVDHFERMLRHTPVTVVMPDVRYVGGVRALAAVATSAARAGKRCSPHNPSGPVSTLATAHALAAREEPEWLEYPVEAVTWRSELLRPAEEVHTGTLTLPAGAGLGSRLDHDVAGRHGPRSSLRPLGALA